MIQPLRPMPEDLGNGRPKSWAEYLRDNRLSMIATLARATKDAATFGITTDQTSRVANLEHAFKRPIIPVQHLREISGISVAEEVAIENRVAEEVKAEETLNLGAEITGQVVQPPTPQQTMLSDARHQIATYVIPMDETQRMLNDL